MEIIRIIEKPDWISWDDVQTCIVSAHSVNQRKGVDMLAAHETGDDLRREVGDGYCFVALNENGKVIGTSSLKISNIHFWFHRGLAGYRGWEGVVPEYRGTDVYLNLRDAVIKKQNELGIKVIWGRTSENNKTVIKLLKKSGCKIVQYSPSSKGSDYYSVIFAVWKNGCPYSDRMINFMFMISKIVTKLLYKPGKRLRLFFWK